MSDPIQPTSSFKFNPDVTVRVMDNEAVLLNVRTGAYFGLNKVGTVIWQLYSEGKTVAEVVSNLCERYGIASERATTDVQALTQKLLEKELLRTG